MLKNESFLAFVTVHTAENEPYEVYYTSISVFRKLPEFDSDVQYIKVTISSHAYMALLSQKGRPKAAPAERAPDRAPDRGHLAFHTKFAIFDYIYSTAEGKSCLSLLRFSRIEVKTTVGKNCFAELGTKNSRKLTR